ncbi:MAG TPA: hypothetical protein VLW83_05870 [Candidatus Acidoferrales bacterium]|nr:hypothetical protein [Candidatus Acidoferrum sp.]HUJ81389.1 hypothetical protein [Candidatus Acidoferrales bacterium]
MSRENILPGGLTLPAPFMPSQQEIERGEERRPRKTKMSERDAGPPLYI